MLLDQTAVTATFKPGASPLGHHWELTDPEGTPLGRTRREYSGNVLSRGLWRTVTATGMDANNDIRAEVLDADGTVVAHLFSRNEKDPRVEVSRPDGAEVGVVRHDESGFRYDAGGRTVATLPVPDRNASPWELLDAGGTRIGVVDRVKAQRVAGPTLLDIATGLATIADNASDFQRTMHLGFAFSGIYSVALAELPSAEPLRTLCVLTPVILGYAY